MEHILNGILDKILESKDSSGKVRIIIDGRLFKTYKGKSVWASKQLASTAFSIGLETYMRKLYNIHIPTSSIKEFKEKIN